MTVEDDGMDYVIHAAGHWTHGPMKRGMAATLIAAAHRNGVTVTQVRRTQNLTGRDIAQLRAEGENVGMVAPFVTTPPSNAPGADR